MEEVSCIIYLVCCVFVVRTFSFLGGLGHVPGVLNSLHLVALATYLVP